MNATVALHDGRAGNARQAMALAQALEHDSGECVLHPSAPWRWLAPHLLPATANAFGTAFSNLAARPPQLAIGCGRQAALATRLLRERGSRAVQILDPRIDPRHWDLVIVPEHDELRGENVIPMLGSLHPVNHDWLSRAMSAFADLAVLPEPHTVLLVGGPSRHAPLQHADFAGLLQRLAAQARAERGSFSVIASRRTPADWRGAMTQIDRRLPGLRWRDTGDGANPFAGLLAYADRIVCTPDSVNMLSEAAATYAPVFVWSAACVDHRLRQFLEALRARGHVRDLDATLEPFASEPLRETERIAGEVRRRLGHPPH